jgi:hypothetical protein
MDDDLLEEMEDTAQVDPRVGQKTAESGYVLHNANEYSPEVWSFVKTTYHRREWGFNVLHISDSRAEDASRHHDPVKIIQLIIAWLFVCVAVMSFAGAIALLACL